MPFGLPLWYGRMDFFHYKTGARKSKSGFSTKNAASAPDAATHNRKPKFRIAGSRRTPQRATGNPTRRKPPPCRKSQENSRRLQMQQKTPPPAGIIRPWKGEIPTAEHGKEVRLPYPGFVHISQKCRQNSSTKIGSTLDGKAKRRYNIV